MQVANILKVKGHSTMTVHPSETVQAFATRLKLERVGAMPVSEDGKTLVGIISERDVAHGFAAHGSALVNMKVADLMTTGVVTCTPTDTIMHVARLMTRRRIRHLPVIEHGQLVGLISIGDVLNHRLGEIELEADILRDIAIVRR
jgi:CBS domain-containing protein